MAAIHTSKRVLALSDVHLPFANERVLKLALQFKKDFKPDVTLALGDWIDVSAAASFARDVEDFDTLDEIDACNELLDRFNPDVFFEGNHEYRLRKAGNLNQEIRRLLDLRYWLDLKKRRIKWVPYDHHSIYRLGNLVFIHGFASGVSAGRKEISKFGNVVHGHTHRVAISSEFTPLGTAFSYNIGCLCQIKELHYIRSKSPPGWSNGFGYGVIRKSGTHQFNVVSISENQKRIMLNGKDYSL